MKKRLKKDTSVATHHDLDIWGGRIQELIGEAKTELRGEISELRHEVAEFKDEINKRFDKLETRMDSLETRMGELGRAMESVLIILGSIEGRLKELTDLPERVERLENKVLGPRR